MALVLAGLAAAGLILVLPHATASWSAARAFPFQLDAEEGFILHGAVTLASGGSLYRPLTEPPFLVGNYPPLYYWLFGLLNGPRVSLASLGLGRALAQGAAVLAAFALAVIAAVRTRRLIPALLAALLFFCSYEVAHWSAFARVDLPALALTIIGLGLFLCVPGRWGAVASAAVLVAAGYTRQTALLAPAAIVLALALRDRRRLAWFLAPYAGLGLLALVTAQAVTGGEFFRHVVTYNQNVMDWAGWRRVMKNEVWFFYRAWIMTIAWGIYWGVRQLRGSFKSKTPLPAAADLAPTLYLLLAAASLLSYAKVGAAPNYVLEPLAAAALWTALTAGGLIERLRNAEYGIPHEGIPSTARRWAARIGLWNFLFLLAIHAVQMLVHTRLQWSATPGPADREAGRQLLAELRAAPGDVYCEDPVYTLLAGKPVLFQPFIMSQLAREGQWNQRPVLEWLRARRFSRFVVGDDLTPNDGREYDRYTGAMVQALNEQYTPEKRLELHGIRRTFFIWRGR